MHLYNYTYSWGERLYVHDPDLRVHALAIGQNMQGYSYRCGKAQCQHMTTVVCRTTVTVIWLAHVPISLFTAYLQYIGLEEMLACGYQARCRTPLQSCFVYRCWPVVCISLQLILPLAGSRQGRGGKTRLLKLEAVLSIFVGVLLWRLIPHWGREVCWLCQLKWKWLCAPQKLTHSIWAKLAHTHTRS